MLAAATSLCHHSDVQIPTDFNPGSEASPKALLSHDLHGLEQFPEFLWRWPVTEAAPRVVMWSHMGLLQHLRVWLRTRCSPKALYPDPDSESFPLRQMLSSAEAVCGLSHFSPTLHNPRDCSPSGSSVHGIL